MKNGYGFYAKCIVAGLEDRELLINLPNSAILELSGRKGYDLITNTRLIRPLFPILDKNYDLKSLIRSNCIKKGTLIIRKVEVISFSEMLELLKSMSSEEIRAYKQSVDDVKKHYYGLINDIKSEEINSIPKQLKRIRRVLKN